MKANYLQIDDFFKDPDRAFLDISRGEFSDYQSSWDGVVYPGINAQLPAWIADFTETKLAKIMARKIVVTAMFARLTIKSQRTAPHKVHSDRIMGQFSHHVYLSQEWPVGAGTSFWTHETEGPRHTDDTEVSLIVRDQNDESRWTLNALAQAQFNRSIIHDSNWFHMAEPSEGFGWNSKDGRLVLTTFFSEAN